METFPALLALCAGNSPHKGQWSGALMLSLICAWINGWENNLETRDLRHHRTHYDVIVMHLVVLAWTGHELSYQQARDWYTDGRTDGDKDNTQRPNLSSGKNCVADKWGRSRCFEFWLFSPWRVAERKEQKQDLHVVDLSSIFVCGKIWKKGLRKIVSMENQHQVISLFQTCFRW